MQITPHKAFNFLTAKFRQLERSGNRLAFEAFIGSEKYLANFLALRPGDRHRVMVYSVEARRSIYRRDPEKPVPRYSEKGWRSWPPERVAKLKAAEAKTGSDMGIAREMGISYNAAKAARRKYIGNRVTSVGGGLYNIAA